MLPVSEFPRTFLRRQMRSYSYSHSQIRQIWQAKYLARDRAKEVIIVEISLVEINVAITKNTHLTKSSVQPKHLFELVWTTTVDPSRESCSKCDRGTQTQYTYRAVSPVNIPITLDTVPGKVPESALHENAQSHTVAKKAKKTRIHLYNMTSCCIACVI
jgi:hypothetical protein